MLCTENASETAIQNCAVMNVTNIADWGSIALEWPEFKNHCTKNVTRVLSTQITKDAAHLCMSSDAPHVMEVCLLLCALRHVTAAADYYKTPFGRKFIPDIDVPHGNIDGDVEHSAAHRAMTHTICTLIRWSTILFPSATLEDSMNSCRVVIKAVVNNAVLVPDDPTADPFKLAWRRMAAVCFGRFSNAPLSSTGFWHAKSCLQLITWSEQPAVTTIAQQLFIKTPELKHAHTSKMCLEFENNARDASLTCGITSIASWRIGRNKVTYSADGALVEYDSDARLTVEDDTAKIGRIAKLAILIDTKWACRIAGYKTCTFEAGVELYISKRLTEQALAAALVESVWGFYGINGDLLSSHRVSDSKELSLKETQSDSSDDTVAAVAHAMT